MKANGQNLKEVLREQREEYQRFLGVLAENFESQVKLIAESMEGIQQQLISIRDMVAKNTEDIEEIKSELHIVRSDEVRHVSREEVELLEKRIARLEKVRGK